MFIANIVRAVTTKMKMHNLSKLCMKYQSNVEMKYLLTCLIYVVKERRNRGWADPALSDTSQARMSLMSFAERHFPSRGLHQLQPLTRGWRSPSVVYDWHQASDDDLVVCVFSRGHLVDGARDSSVAGLRRGALRRDHCVGSVPRFNI